MFEVTDDSGFLALVVPTSYESFVSSKWTFDQIMSHFHAQMARRSVLIWGTGLEGCWKVEIELKKADIKGFREVSGPMHIVGGSLLLTNYESLTMAAQFKDVTLPEKHQKHLLVSLPDGDYTCRVIQMFDPGQVDTAESDNPDFVVEILEAAENQAVWRHIRWFPVDR